MDDTSFFLGINSMSLDVCSSHFETSNCLTIKGLWPFNLAVQTITLVWNMGHWRPSDAAAHPRKTHQNVEI